MEICQQEITALREQVEELEVDAEVGRLVKKVIPNAGDILRMGRTEYHGYYFANDSSGCDTLVESLRQAASDKEAADD